MEINNNTVKNPIQQSNQITPQIPNKPITVNNENQTNTQTQITQDNISLSNLNNNLNEANNNVAKFSSMIGNPFEQNPFYQNPIIYNNPYLINSAYYDPNVNTINNSNNLWKYLLVGGLGLLTGAALSSMMFYSYPLYYPMYYSYYYSPCWYNFYPYMWW